MAKLIDGKAKAAEIRQSLKAETEALKNKYGAVPVLAVILAGNNAASEIYVANKIKACGETGIISKTIRLTDSVSEEELLKTVSKLNKDKTCNGILVQLPLPKHINEAKILDTIAAEKDVDGFTPENAGRLLSGMEGLLPCTPAGIIELIKSTGEPIEGKNAVIVGRSNIVGKPAAVLLLRENATVTVAHSKTRKLAEICAAADILVVAIGKKGFLTGEYIKEGATVIDVGMNRADGKLYGDVNFPEAEKKAAFITPVPGGVGPMTIAMLLKNTVKAFIAQQQK